MKPEKGLDEMEEIEFDPREMFAEMGLLILEARTPELSPKGRVEGPHCPPVKGFRDHTCDRHKEQCRKASDLLSFQEILWQNKIPMRIDVLLFPDCEHGQREETIVEGASFSCMDSFELLERWDVQLIKKRSPEKLDGLVTGRIHLQAVRSYLHFSQLSSWLISSGGAIPFRVVYRIYAPGEAVGYTFSMMPTVHSFPFAELSNVVMQSTVMHLPRQERYMTMTCRSLSPSVEHHLRSRKMCVEDKRKNSPMSDPYRNPRPSTSKCDADCSKYEKMHSGKTVQKPPIGRKFQQEEVLKSRDIPSSVTAKRKVDQLSPSLIRGKGAAKMTRGQSSKFENISSQNMSQSTSGEQGKINPDVQLDSLSSKGDRELKTPEKHSSSKVHPYRKPDSLTVSTNNAFIGSKRLPSPKVLVTGSRKPDPTEYKKRCLDLSKRESPQDAVDNFPGLKPLEEITSDDLHDLIKPLSPSDLEAYLTSLSNKASRRIGVSKLDEIPTTKCSFYLNDNEEKKTESSELKRKNAGIYPTDKPKSLSSTKTQRLSHNAPDQEDRLDGEHHVRRLFSRSISSPEIETKFVISDNEANSICDNRSDTSNDSKEQLDDLTNCCQVVSHDGKTKPCEESDLPSLKCLSRDTTHAGPTQNVSSKNLSIPCKIGGNNSALTSLVQNLEGMEICDETKSTTQASSVDREVEGHMVQCSVQNGFTEPREVADSTVQSESEATTTICDTNTARDLSLCKQLLKKEFQQNVKNEMMTHSAGGYKNLPSPDDIRQFQFVMGRSASAIFNATTGLPSRSSPAPIKRKHSTRFDYDCTLTNVRAIKNAISCSKLTLQSEDNFDTIEDPKILSTSAPASTNCLLGNFEESVLNGRIEPVGVVEGFSAEIGAGGTFCPKHVTLPVMAYFFQLSEDNAPSPYLGYVNLEPLGKRGYHIPRTGTVQVTLFNPNKAVLKMFVVMYDLSDMPANCQTFLRQRTMYTPVDVTSKEPSYLRYLIHLRFQSSKSGKIYLHTDIRLIFARDKFEFDPQVANYELRSFTEGPENPKFSPKR